MMGNRPGRSPGTVASFADGRSGPAPTACNRRFAGLFGWIGSGRTVDCTSGIGAARGGRAALWAEEAEALARGRTGQYTSEQGLCGRMERVRG